MLARVGGAVLTAAAVVYLHLALSVFFWLLRPTLGTALTPTWELAGLMALLLGVAWWGRASRRVIRALLAALTVLVTGYLLIGLGQGFARREFGYDVVLALHLPYVPELFRMMYKAEPLYMFVLYVLLLVGGVTLVIAGIYLALRRILRTTAADRQRLVSVAAALVLYLGLTIPLLGIHGPLTRQLVEQVDMAVNLARRLDSTARQMALEATRLREQNPFKTMERPPTIFLIIVESYGQVLLADPDFASFQRDLRAMGQEFGAAGYHIRSRYLDAPVIGGSSWMADAALLCGVKVHNQRRYNGLYKTSIPCLPKLLNEAGYLTILAAPNTTYADKKFDRLFPFARHYFKDDFQYAGPRFTWSYMPDQYAIHFVHERELVKRPEQPLFVTFILANSHHPWNKIPTYVEDWSTLGRGELYWKHPFKKFSNSFVTGEEFKPAFLASIEYVLQTVKEYVKRLPDQDNTLIVILGDHQPRKPITDMERDPWTVPIHVLSRNPALVDRFASIGYNPGIVPDAAVPAVGMEHFLHDLFRAFSTPRAATPGLAPGPAAAPVPAVAPAPAQPAAP